MRGDMAARLCGSRDVFDRRHRRPWAGVNFVASHDGFTTQDLVSYNGSHNEANGEGGNDGHGENYSHNWGEEGPTQDAAILERRGQVQRALLATLFLSDGTPMLLAGDEFGNSQDGNNNAYCQDNPLSWLDWTLAQSDAGRALTHFVARAVALRRDHPSLRAARFGDAAQEICPGVAAIGWFDTAGGTIAQEAWDDPQALTMALRRAALREDGSADITLLLLNPGAEPATFTLPPPAQPWIRELDSATQVPAAPISETDITVQAHSLVLLSAACIPGAAS
jgi:glycogen operon protein